MHEYCHKQNLLARSLPETTLLLSVTVFRNLLGNPVADLGIKGVMFDQNQRGQWGLCPLPWFWSNMFKERWPPCAVVDSKSYSPLPFSTKFLDPTEIMFICAHLSAFIAIQRKHYILSPFHSVQILRLNDKNYAKTKSFLEIECAYIRL